MNVHLLNVLLVIVAFASTICSGQIDEDETSLKYVTKECNSKLGNINSIGKFETFMKHYAIVTGRSEKPKRGILNLDKSLRTCYDLKGPLAELESIVSGRHEGVCRMGYINRLVDFHSNHLLKQQVKTTEQETSSGQQSNSSYIQHFFSVYAHQVALTCKSRLNDRILEAQSRHDCSDILSRFLSPAIMDEDGDKPGELSGVASFLQNFRRVEDFVPIIVRDTQNEPYFNVIIKGETVEMLENLKGQCRLREPYYTSLFSPIATLAQLGYDIAESTSDSNDLSNAETKVLKCWLATAQLCQGILRTHVDQGDGIDHDQTKLVGIKFGKVPSDIADSTLTGADPAGLEFDDTFDDIYPGVSDEVKRKASIKGKMKRMAYTWAKNFIERHVDIEGKRNEAIGKFIGALATNDNNGQDRPVAFNGKQTNQGLYNPATFLTDDSDTFVQLATIFISNKIKLAFSCVVAVALSAVFVWFTLYALTTTVKVHLINNKSDNANFKADWLELRSKRMEKIDNKLQRKGLKDKLMVYKGQ